MDAIKEITFTHRYWVILLPLILIGADIVTGWIQASVNGTWDSTKMRKGLFRKSGELLTIVVAYAIQEAIVLPLDVTSCISAYIIIMELLSILENLDQAGVPVPVFIKSRLGKVVKQMDEEEQS